jgi:hypothetical protein
MKRDEKCLHKKISIKNSVKKSVKKRVIKKHSHWGPVKAHKRHAKKTGKKKSSVIAHERRVNPTAPIKTVYILQMKTSTGKWIDVCSDHDLRLMKSLYYFNTKYNYNNIYRLISDDMLKHYKR